MNAPQVAVARKRNVIIRILARIARFIVWQRVPVQQMRIANPGREALLWIAYSAFYVFLSAVTGLIIRRHAAPNTLFLGNPWYVLFFKIGFLLIVPLIIFYAQGYRVRDLLLDWRPSTRNIIIAVAAFGIGFLINWSHLAKIVPAAQSIDAGPAVLRIGAALVLPLLMAGIPEEVVYRGILQTRLEAVMGRVAAILLQTALFAAWHFPSRYFLSSGIEGQAGNAWSVFVGTVIPVFIVGLIFSILWDRYRRLVPLITLHWGVDVLPIMSTVFGIKV